ncbi:MAG: hypothetical protein LKM39_11400 [Chiayiivirga sp.]|nr:hypothetical protein [Chiayiivirga sp.]
MTMQAFSPSTIAVEIERYLRSGDSDMMGSAWPGDIMERGRSQRTALRGALLDEVRRLSKGRTHAAVPDNAGVEFTRAKVEPMVRGLFPKAEQEVVLAMLEGSVVYVTSETIGSIIMNQSWNRSAWELANLFLLSVGAELLGPDAPHVVGISEETTCYVSPDYFAEADPFADFIVHEAAHVFHNCKRRTIGLRETRAKEWLLDIEYRRRETFAYACEAYARVLSRAKGVANCRALAAEYVAERRIADERVDPDEVASIVLEAASARNGWKVILARCAPMTNGSGQRPAPTSEITRLGTEVRRKSGRNYSSSSRLSR